jgi:RNA polymerase sigma-70 factor (ECF subfamily)
MIPDTSLGLLERLQSEQFDQKAWEEFVRRYGRVLTGWARRWGAQGSDSQDLAQEVLLKLLHQMRDFRYDPKQSFRGWLKTVAYRTLRRQQEKSQRYIPLGGSWHGRLVDSVEAREDLERLLWQHAERELFELAAEQVRQRVRAVTWQAFELAAIEGLGGEEIAARLGISLSSVYVARYNVQKMLREEILLIGGGG